MRLPAFLLAGALVLSACDATSDTVSADDDLDDAAVVLASAIALDSGGALEDAAAGASLAVNASAGARHAGPDRPGCENDRSYDAATGFWTASIDCERGDPEGRRYATFERLATYQFLDAAGLPQELRDGAASASYQILSAESLSRSPRGVHALTSLSSDLTVTDLGEDLVTVNGTYQRAATDTLRGRRGQRTVDYAFDAILTDIQGPRALPRSWRQAVSGTISGTFQATITRTPTDGETVSRDIDRAFEITFPRDGSDRVAEIVLGGKRYRADVETGEVQGLSD
ncbi:MAG: hypothetical protein AAGK21_00615 [Bacteroidota bacterium]